MKPGTLPKGRRLKSSGIQKTTGSGSEVVVEAPKNVVDLREYK